ncbi:chromate resistance protein ChrB domain-containing protein [Phreatobacter oligotrophus]|uniref:chromate resistance protein ChrB domain-containing protein n=1 Tax=Phreatobacter oligotrophus TaxID=1122261 RepID=UPI002352A24E|nr:chromate resistance protein ChrB domain-containing protein [Phreatobacter oligotrophus]MBX9992843.1 chromate resistance protein [Phreatobacter oligotrophus]
MASSPFFISPDELAGRLGSPDGPQIIDVRAAEVRAVQPDLPSARWVADSSGAAVAAVIDPARPVVISCKAGLNRSQRTAADLRAMGIPARVLSGGSLAFAAAGHPVIPRAAVDAWGGPGRAWVTRRGPKIDRVACPWLITRFLDPAARFLFTDADQVLAVAADVGGTAFDTPGAPIEHDGPGCSFDTLLEAIGLAGFAPLADLAVLVRAADTNDLTLSREAAGYLAVSLGLSALAGEDDHAMLRHGFVVLDGLYAWITRARTETHSWTHRA